MVEASIHTERISTGVPGLDQILEGGLLKGGVYIVQGPPGSGKTILGNQFCFHHAARGAQAVYLTLLAESHTRMISHIRRLSFFQPELVSEKVYFISAFKVLEEQGLDGLLTTLRSAVTARDASIVVLDGLASAEESAPTDRQYKKFLHELQVLSGLTGCTVLLLSSHSPGSSSFAEHTMVDGILELSDEVAKLRSLRHLQVRKIRGTEQVRGKHTLEITGDGVVIRARLESQLKRTPEDAPWDGGSDRKEFGVPALDRMLRGGLPDRSMTMILGPSGSGKTILGLQWLAAGARRDQPGLHFGFYERPSVLLEKSRRLHLGLDQTKLHFLWQPPVEGVLDILGERLLRTVEKEGIRRLCIDAMEGFQIAADFPERVRDVFSVLSDELERLGVSTVYAMELPQLFAPEIEPPIKGISAVTENIILLRHVELDAHVRRLISILKLRDSGYDSAIREFKIDAGGLSIADTFADSEQLLGGSATSSKPPDGKNG